jgi:hypothetical protein
LFPFLGLGEIDIAGLILKFANAVNEISITDIVITLVDFVFPGFLLLRLHIELTESVCSIARILVHVSLTHVVTFIRKPSKFLLFLLLLKLALFLFGSFKSFLFSTLEFVIFDLLLDFISS